jgi:hypothetical protein
MHRDGTPARVQGCERRKETVAHALATMLSYAAESCSKETAADPIARCKVVESFGLASQASRAMEEPWR